ncbi:MAG: ribonuclease P protein component [Burkholderiaceae bacterium]|nr:ribonuclease P protein component [Burkholderiaceae bacterium]
MARNAQAAADRTEDADLAWRNLKSADFALALATPALGKSPHFVLHHVAASPAAAVRHACKPDVPELSTDNAPNGSIAVDNTPTPNHWWLGLVVPKRHARRAVTRSLLKRQMRVQADGHRDRLAPGQWIIRLRAPFDPRRYPSAASSQLRDAARQELEQVFARVVTA